MPGPCISAAMCERIRRLHAVHSLKAIAEITGVSESTVGRIARRGYTVATPGPPRRPLPWDWVAQVDRMNHHQLRQHYQASGSTIRRWLKLHPRAPRKHPSPTNKAPLPNRDDLLAALEHGVAGACERLGVTGNTLRRMRREMGLPIRAHGIEGVRKNLIARNVPPPQVDWSCVGRAA